MVMQHAQDCYGEVWTRQDNKPIVVFEDNVICIAQVEVGFIKTSQVKHIYPHIFGFTQYLIQSGHIEVKKVDSAHNVIDMLIKVISAYINRRLVHEVGMILLHEIVHL